MPSRFASYMMPEGMREGFLDLDDSMDDLMFSALGENLRFQPHDPLSHSTPHRKTRKDQNPLTQQSGLKSNTNKQPLKDLKTPLYVISPKDMHSTRTNPRSNTRYHDGKDKIFVYPNTLSGTFTDLESSEEVLPYNETERAKKPWVPPSVRPRARYKIRKGGLRDRSVDSGVFITRHKSHRRRMTRTCPSPHIMSPFEKTPCRVSSPLLDEVAFSFMDPFNKTLDDDFQSTRSLSTDSGAWDDDESLVSQDDLSERYEDDTISSIYNSDSEESHQLGSTHHTELPNQESFKPLQSTDDMLVYDDSHKLVNMKATEALNTNIDQISQSIESRAREMAKDRDTVQRHLETRRQYYHALVDKWFWKNRMLIDSHASINDNLLADMRAKITEIRQESQNLEKQISGIVETRNNHMSKMEEELSKQIRVLEQCVSDLKTGCSNPIPLRYTFGRSPALNCNQLGNLMIHSTSTEVNERITSPGSFLFSFDSRHGSESDYLATGISVATNGDIIVSDTGMDTVQVFSSAGSQRSEVNVTPFDNPSKAVQFGEEWIAVACATGVKLYNRKDGIYARKQLKTGIERPQGLAVDQSGDLVVSGYHVDIPVICVVDKHTLEVKDTIIGENNCCEVQSQPLWEELSDQDLTNHSLFSSPWYITADQSGNIIISDRDNHTVNTITKSGETVQESGSLGSTVGQFFQPAGICVDPNGRVIVADSKNHRVQVLAPGEDSPIVLLDQEHDEIEFPMDVSLNEKGQLLILQGNGIVKVFQYL